MSTDNSNPTPSPKPKWASRMGTAMRRATMIPSSSSSTSLALEGTPPVTSKDDMDTASVLGNGDDTASINLTKSAAKGTLFGRLSRKGSMASLDPASVQALASSSATPPPPQAQGHDEADRISVRSKETSRGMFGLRGRRGTSSASVDRVAAPEGEVVPAATQGGDGDADTASVKGKSPGRSVFGLKKKSGSSASLDRMTSPLAKPAITAEEDTDRASVRSKSPSRSFLGMKVKRNTSNVSLEQPQQSQDATTDRPIIKKKTSRSGSLLSFGLGKKNASKTSLEITPPGSSPSAPGSRAPTPPLSHAGYTPSPIAESPMREEEATRLEQQQGSSLARQAHVVFTEPEAAANPHPAEDDPNADAEAAYLTSPTDYVPPPVIDSTAGNPGAFMDDPESLPQPTIVNDPWGAGGTGHADWVQELGNTASPVLERGVGGGTVASPVSAIPKASAEEHVDLTKGEAAEYYNPPPPAPFMPEPEPHSHVGPEPENKVDEAPNPPTIPHDASISSPQTYEPSPDKRYGEYQWSAKPKDVEVPYDGEAQGEAIYVDPGTKGIEMPHPDPYPISTSPHQTTFSPHDEGAYIPTIPSESSPLLPTQPQLPRPGFFDEDTAHWEWEPHRLMSGSSYFVCGVKWSGGVRRVVTDLDMSREDVRRSVGEFVRMKIGGGSVEVVPYTSGTSGATGGGDIDLDGEWYVRELEDPERIAALLEIQRQRQGTDDENGTSTNGKLLKKGRTKKKRRSTMPAPPVLLLEMWSVDHVQRRATRWGDERRDYESGGETVGYGSMGSTGPWGWKGKSTSHGDTAEENEEDALDSAYRYWLYVDSHPSHVGLPAHAREEALEILEWAWTDGVLPASGAASHFSSTPGRPKSGVIAPEGGQRVSFAKPPPLFGQEECDELRKALLAFEDEGHHDQSHGKKRPSLSISTGGRSTPSHGHTHSHSHSLSQSYPYCQSYPSSQPQAQNRLIARIFLRLLGWRQAHFRSDLPLPSSAFDVPYPPLPPYALPVSRETQEREIGARERARERRQSVFLPSKQNKTSWAKITRDFVGLVLCLGIPYLFVKRAVVDRENGERGVSSTVNLNGATGYVLPRREGEGTVGMFIMWGVTCVLAATTLSLSIALITLPASDPSQGSDRWSFTIPRIAALVALIFAVASLIASGVVIWRHSHEHHHLHNRRDSMGGRRRTLPLEGVVVKETLIPSLPIVFLAYAIMALVFAVVMFLVKNGTFTHKGIDTSSMVGDFIDEKIGQIGGGEWRKFSLLLFGGAVGAMVGIGYVVLWG